MCFFTSFEPLCVVTGELLQSPGDRGVPLPGEYHCLTRLFLHQSFVSYAIETSSIWSSLELRTTSYILWSLYWKISLTAFMRFP